MHPEPTPEQLDAIESLNTVDRARFRREHDLFAMRIEALHTAARNGVGIAPGAYAPLDQQYRLEARRREALGDPTWRAWSAWADYTANLA